MIDVESAAVGMDGLTEDAAKRTKKASVKAASRHEGPCAGAGPMHPFRPFGALPIPAEVQGIIDQFVAACPDGRCCIACGVADTAVDVLGKAPYPWAYPFNKVTKKNVGHVCWYCQRISSVALICNDWHRLHQFVFGSNS